MNAPLAITHRPEQGRFEVLVDGLRCECDYTLQGDLMLVTHTGVPPQLEGRGIAAQLVRAALDHARGAGWRVRPLCSYVAAYMRRHPETKDLLAN